MRLTWHLVRKDLLRFRIPLLLWTLLIVVKHLFFGFIAGVWGEANLALLAPFQNGPGQFLSLTIEPLIAYVLVAALVYEDPPAGRDPFWVTRPISGRRLLVAKLLGAGLMFVAWPILLSLPWWFECGYDAGAIALTCGALAAIYSAVVLVGMACASATNAYPRYFLWTLAALAAFAIALGLAGALRHAVIGPTLNDVVVHVGIILVALIFLSLAVIRHQFVVRYFRRSVAVLAGVTVFVSALAFSSPLHGVAAWFDSADPARPTDQDIQFSLSEPMRLRNFLKNNSVATLAVPVTITGLSQDTTAFLRVSGTWAAADGKVWSERGANSFDQFRARASRHLLGLDRPDDSRHIAEVQFVFKKRYAQRIADEAASFRGTATLDVFDGRLLFELPLRNQAKRFGGGSLSMTRLKRDATQLTFIMTVRERADLNFRLGYFALLNRRTGEIVEPGRTSRMGTGTALINLVKVTWVPVFFEIPATPGWLDDATLVMVGFSHAHRITRELENPHLAAFVKPPAEAQEILPSPDGLPTRGPAAAGK